MRIKALKTMAGPQFCIAEGKEADLPEAVARMLAADGAAELLEDVAADQPAEVVDKTEKPKPKRGRKKSKRPVEEITDG